MLTGKHGGITVREAEKPVIYGAGEERDAPRTVKVRALMTFSALSGNGLRRNREEFWTTLRRAEAYEKKNLVVRLAEMTSEVHEIHDEPLEVADS